MVGNVSYPNLTRNYCVFDENRIKEKKNFEVIKNTLNNPKSDEEVLETLCALDLMIDDGADIDRINLELYPALSKYNQTKDPNIQTYLAGIYRKQKCLTHLGPYALCLSKMQSPHTKIAISIQMKK